MLLDGDAIQRAHRIDELLRSEIPIEREVGGRESAHLYAWAEQRSAQLFAQVLLGVASHLDAHYVAASAGAPPLPPASVADTEWEFCGVDTLDAVLQGRAIRPYTAYSRWLNGRALVVRESRSMPGSYYATVDGIHISGIPGAPRAYPASEWAMEVAENVARGGRPSSVESIRSASGYHPPGPRWAPGV